MSCGIYIPRLRIKREEYQKTWGYFAPRWLEEKSVAGFDEDPITMGVEAASNALRNASFEASAIDAVLFASTSPPYAEKQNASTIAAALGCKRNIASLDVTSSTKCGLSALLSGLDFVSSGRGDACLVVASDSPSGNPVDSLDHQLGAAAAAAIVGRDQQMGTVEGTFSVTTESLGERFRRDGQNYVSTVDLGRYHETISEDAVTSCVKGLIGKLNRSPRDYDFFGLHGVEEPRAIELARRLGFEENKITPAMVSGKIGDVGSASPLLGLSRILESASVRQHMILCSYGSGGADAISVAAENEMKPARGLGFEDYLERKEYIDYATYLKLRKFSGRN